MNFCKLLLAFILVHFAYPAFAQTIIYESDFNSGTAGWVVNPNESTSSGDPFLGRLLPNQTAVQTFSVPDLSKTVEIEFDFLEIDSWDGDTGDNFSLSIDGVEIFDLPFYHNGRAGTDGNDAARNGTTGNVTWSVEPITDNTIQLGFSSWQDQIHKVKLLVSNPNPTLELEFFANFDQTDEALGIDNISIVQDADPNVTAQKSVASAILTGSQSYALPGSEMIYSIDISSIGEKIDNGSMVFTDQIPTDVILFTGDFDGSGQPVSFVDSSTPVSGLSCCVAANISYSDDVGSVPVYDYVPASNYDPIVRHLRVILDGQARNGVIDPVNVQLSFKAKIK